MAEMDLPESGRKVRVVLKKVFGDFTVSGETVACKAIGFTDGEDAARLETIFFEGCCELGCVFFSRKTFATHVESWEYE